MQRCLCRCGKNGRHGTHTSNPQYGFVNRDGNASKNVRGDALSKARGLGGLEWMRSVPRPNEAPAGVTKMKPTQRPSR